MEQIKMQKQKIMAVLAGLIGGYVVTALLLALLAFLLFKMNLDEGKVSVGISAVYVLSCFAAGFLVGKKLGRQKFLWGFLTGACYFLLLLGISTIVQPGAMTGINHLLSAFGMCAAGGMAGGMIS